MVNFILPSVHDANVNVKRVFVRCDFDVPIIQQSANSDQPLVIADETRLISSISTIEYLLENGATVIAGGHLGRPVGRDKKFSLEPIAKWFEKELSGSNLSNTELGGFSGWKIKENFYILENLRFDKREEENDHAFAMGLSNLADIYVNEAFGSSHRFHASIVGIASLLPHFAGFHLTKEVKILRNVLENPKRPLTIIIGGAKIETKLPLVSKMHRFADYVLVGGELAEQDKILIKEQHENITGQKAMLLVADLNSEKTDIMPMSLENFEQIIQSSKCIVWNGPMGFLEKGFEDSSLTLAKAIIASSAYKVVGGGDTVGFLNKHGLLDKFNFVSVGGGAMLKFLSGESLPGLVALGS